MPTTPNAALRYPAPSAAPDVPGDIYNLASDIDNFLFVYRNSGWTSYTPALSNIGASMTAQYRYHANKVWIRFYGTISSNAGNGNNITMSLPVSRQTVTGIAPLATGTAYASKSSTIYPFDIDFTDANTARFYYRTGSPNTLAPVTTAAPITWANGDAFYGEFAYDI